MRQSRSVVNPIHRGRAISPHPEKHVNKKGPKTSELSKFLPRDLADKIRRKCQERLEDFTTLGTNNKVV